MKTITYYCDLCDGKIENDDRSRVNVHITLAGDSGSRGIDRVEHFHPNCFHDIWDKWFKEGGGNGEKN